MNQSILRFEFRPSYREEDFLVSSTNEEAWRWISGWPQAWPSNTLNIYGPQGCGKTHLAHIWAQHAQAAWMSTERAAHFADVLHEHNAWVVDIADFQSAETPWFHALNQAKERDIWLLFTSQLPLARHPVALSDLASRLKAVPSVGIHPPDDALLQSVLMKRFSDMQLRVSPAVANFLVSRMERSFFSMEKILNRIDILSLQEKRNITLPMVRKILET